MTFDRQISPLSGDFSDDFSERLVFFSKISVFLSTDRGGAVE